MRETRETIRKKLERIVCPPEKVCPPARPPDEMPPPDEFVIRLVEAVMVRRRPVPTVPSKVVVAPPKGPVVPMYIELPLPAGTKKQEVNFGIKAKSINIRTDGDISVNLSRGERSIPILADDSPFDLNLQEGWIGKIWLNSAHGATVKILCATEQISIRYGRKELPSAYRWHWAGQITQPALTLSEYDVYTIPRDRRLVVENAYLSSSVKGVVQRADFLEWDGAELYRFGGTFFDCQAPLPLNYSMAGGKTLKVRTYNYDTEERIIWVVIISREESLK